MKTTSKKLTKVIAVLMTVVMLFGIFACAPFTVSAAESSDAVSGGFNYRFFADDLILISGYTGDETNIKIPTKIGGYTVIGINSEAFYMNDYIETVQIPEGVLMIGERAFAYCERLKSVSMPDTVLLIDQYAFYGSKLYNTSSNWSGGVFYVDNYAIEVDKNATHVSLKHGTIGIANFAAYYCYNLTAFTIPDTVRYVGIGAIFNCPNMPSITVPYDIFFIGDYAFGYVVSNFAGDEPKKIRNFKVQGGKNTIAEDYARECGFQFVDGSIAKSISLNTTNLTLGVGEEYTLIKKVSPSSAANCKWTSSNSSVATVNNNGTVVARKVGTTTITVRTASGLSTSCKVTIKSAPSSINVSAKNLTLGVGEEFVISESTNSGSYACKFDWSSSNSSVATVTKTSGNKAKIVAKSEGTTNITVKTYNGKTATCQLAVKSAPTSVTLSNTNITLGKGETFIISQCSNSGSYAKNFTWSSSNSSVATIEKTSGNKAKITAKNNGTATITFKTYNGKTATCKVTVRNAPSSVKLSKSSITLGNGETYTISESTNSGSFANADNLKWSSSNTNVATITKGANNKAFITAKGNGTATVRITLYNGKTATCNVTVKNAPTSVKLNASNLTLGVGEEFIISEGTNSGTYANADNLKWSSSNTNVVTVTKTSGNKAKIVAKGTGTAKVKITLYNGVTAECNVTVKNAPNTVNLSKTNLILGKGETYIISEFSDSGTYARNFTWSSSNSNVATVEKTSGNKAKIVAKGNGTATITIKTYNGKTATCKVTVKNAPSSVALSTTNLTLVEGETFTIAECTNSGTYANADNLKWSTSNSSVAKIESAGGNKATITAVSQGVATVTITTYNGKTSSCVVKVIPYTESE